jgi:hypothetical protein
MRMQDWNAAIAICSPIHASALPLRDLFLPATPSQDSVHTRDTILELSGQVSTLAELDPDQLQKQVHEQAEMITDLEATSTTRLYVGLAQGGIVGLATGAAAAWVVSRNLKQVVIESSEDEEEDQA